MKDGENLWLGIDWCLNILVHADNCRSGYFVREIRQGSSGSFGEGLCPGIESMKDAWFLHPFCDHYCSVGNIRYSVSFLINLPKWIRCVWYLFLSVFQCLGTKWIHKKRKGSYANLSSASNSLVSEENGAKVRIFHHFQFS